MVYFYICVMNAKVYSYRTEANRVVLDLPTKVKKMGPAPLGPREIDGLLVLNSQKSL